MSGDVIKQVSERASYLTDLRATFGSASGRRVLSGIYARGRLFEKIYVQNAQIYNLAAVRDFVLELFQDIQEADVEINQTITRESAQPLTTETSDGRGNDQG